MRSDGQHRGIFTGSDSTSGDGIVIKAPGEDKISSRVTLLNIFFSASGKDWCYLNSFVNANATNLIPLQFRDYLHPGMGG